MTSAMAHDDGDDAAERVRRYLIHIQQTLAELGLYEQLRMAQDVLIQRGQGDVDNDVVLNTFQQLETQIHQCLLNTSERTSPTPPTTQTPRATLQCSDDAEDNDIVMPKALERLVPKVPMVPKVLLVPNICPALFNVGGQYSASSPYAQRCAMLMDRVQHNDVMSLLLQGARQWVQRLTSRMYQDVMARNVPCDTPIRYTTWPEREVCHMEQIRQAQHDASLASSLSAADVSERQLQREAFITSMQASNSVAMQFARPKKRMRPPSKVDTSISKTKKISIDTMNHAAVSSDHTGTIFFIFF